MSLARTLLILLGAFLFAATAPTGAATTTTTTTAATTPAPATSPAPDAQRPRRVLMVHSFGDSVPPFASQSTAFESAMKRELGAAVDLEQISLDKPRYAQPEMEEAFAEFLAKRLAKWQPDLVVPTGAPAGQFVAKYRGRLFPHTPVVYSWVNKQTIGADALTDNATFVGQSFDFKDLVEDILQLKPDTNNIVVVFGATPLERYWTDAYRKAFEPYAGRVKFTWVNELSFEQTLELVSKLPPRSFVLLTLLLRDAPGISYNQDDVLRRLTETSAAPVNGMFQTQMGDGIVGGRLFQTELTGTETARVAARILRGEPASSFPPLVVPMGAPTYDWRELRRWGISESRLPPGSIVLFRQPTAWELYRWHIIAAVAVIATQALLICTLLVHRRRRRLAELAQRKAQAEVEQRRLELAHVARVATLGELTATLTHELGQPFTAILANSSAATMLLEAPRPDLAEVREALTDIGADAERAAEVIRRLRAMLKRDTPGVARFDVNDVIRAVARIVRSDATRHGVTIHLDLAPGACPVTADTVQLQQVMLNLMLNAFAAMSGPDRGGGDDNNRGAGGAVGAGGDAGGGGGRVRTVGVERDDDRGGRDVARDLTVRTRLTDGARAVLIEVADSGSGIAAGQLESIFNPFVTSKPEGLGMGLSICRSIVESHRGTIRAANNPGGRGATISITLPAAPAPAPPAPAPHPNRADHVAGTR